MPALLLALVLIGQPPAPAATQTPNGIFVAAYQDLRTQVQAGADPTTTRYLSLHAVPEADRPGFVRALTFALNSVSLNRNFGPVVPVAGRPDLVRIDLASFGLDRHSRAARLEKLAQTGVKLGPGQAARALDPWEQIADADPYFKVTQTYHDGRVFRGWIDPVVELEARQLSKSGGFLSAAHFVLPRLLLERQDGGFYSDLLILPPKEADLYKAFGVDVGFADRFNVKYGGAVLRSSVAIHNRELQHLPTAIGDDETFLWRTFDFLNDDVADKNVYEALAGTVKHDGREIIGTLANGLHWYYLADAKGNQVNLVPQQIAEDRRPDTSRERMSVINAYKCIDCHAPLQGIYPFADEIVQAVYDPNLKQVVATKDFKRGVEFGQAVRSYYLPGLQGRIARQQESYRNHVAACVGLLREDEADPEGLTGRIGASVVRHVERWLFDLVTPEQAAREMGCDLATARQNWQRAGVDPEVGKVGNQGLNNQFAFLLRGRPIRRAAWEKIYRFAVTPVGERFPWELSEKHP